VLGRERVLDDPQSRGVVDAISILRVLRILRIAASGIEVPIAADPDLVFLRAFLGEILAPVVARRGRLRSR